MGTQYFCNDKRRAEAVDDHPRINGIEYLEVLDQEAIPLTSPRQQTLLVRCIKEVPASLREDNVIINGGVRITPIKVEWARRASDAGDLATAGLINPDEETFFTNLDEANQVLLVRTEAAGDFSTYTLRLVLSSTRDEPPPDFDPILSEVSFSFKVECPSEFDCLPDQDCPPERFDEPVINYLAKDYVSFRRVLIDRLSVIMPNWRERNPADLGIALVELLAYAADYLSYYQDAVATEAYLGTARQRASLRRHARLLDYDMHDGCNARAWVCVEVDSDGDGQVLSAINPVTRTPARLSTRLRDGVLIPESDFALLREKQSPVIFELLHDLALYEAHNEIELYTWGDEDCCLPRGATRATLKDDAGNRLRLRPGDVAILEQQIDPATGSPEDADPARRHAVRLTRVSPEATLISDGTRSPGPLRTDDLLSQPIVEIEWDAIDALPYAVCVSTAVDDLTVSNVTTVRGNVVLADHGFTVTGEELPLPQNGACRFRPPLEQLEITFREQYMHRKMRALPATGLLRQDPRRALPAVTLVGDGDTWRAQRDLLDSDRTDTEFVVEMDNGGRATLRFGDGVFGRQPDAATKLTASYRIGNGTAGNIGADTITHLIANISCVIRVRNPLPAVGGTAPESMEEVRQYAPQAFRTQERAVTQADYAVVLERHRQVQKAVATRRWTGSWYTMFVTVDCKGGVPVTPTLEGKLRLYLESFRLAGHDVEIDAPRFVPLEIVMTVCVKPGYFRSEVKRALVETFSSKDLPNGRRGFFLPDNLTFGQPVYMSEVIATAMDVPGVQWVDLNDKTDSPHRFRRWGHAAADEIAAGKVKIDRLEIALLDNDPSTPENGKIEFLMEGGL